MNNGSECLECQKEPIVTLTSLGRILNSTFKVSNASKYDGAHIIRSNGEVTVLKGTSIEWLILTDVDVLLIIAVGNGQVKTVPVGKFYEQNARFEKLAVKTDHVGCRKKLLDAGVNVL